MEESLEGEQRKKKHLSKLFPSSAWTQTESLQMCCLCSFSLYSTAGEKLRYIWHQLAVGKASLWWICFCYFKEAHHKDIVHAFYSIWEKSTFQKYQYCSSGLKYFAITTESVQCPDFRYSCLLQEPVTPPQSTAAAQLWERTGERRTFQTVQLPYQIDGTTPKMSRIM